MPSAEIAHDPGAVRALQARDSPGLVPEDFLEQTDTDAMAVLHRGRLVFERYGNGMTRETPHILMSVSKSMLGLLVAELGLDTTAYRGATLRHLLDMRAGIAFDEDYLATSGAIIEYRKSTGWDPLGPGESPSDLKSFFSSLKESDGVHGGRFHYCSPNTDLLGWVIERATGRRYAELMSERVWKKIGAEHSAYITVDRLGAPRCAGGMCVTLRDLARVGQYYPGMPMRYRSQWYFVDGLAFGMGIHGQNLFVDAANEIVIAKLSSQAQPLDRERIALTMRKAAELRKALG